MLLLLLFFFQSVHIHIHPPQFQCHARKKTTGSLELLERARAVLELIETPDCYVRGRACDVVRALCRVAGGARAGIPMGGQAAPTVPTLGVHPVPHCEPTHMNLTPNLETSWTSAGLDWGTPFFLLFACSMEPWRSITQRGEM